MKRPIEKFSITKYKKACRDYKTNWEAVEIALYGLCKRYSKHQTKNAINAKLWIIGRTYATGIERKIKSKGTQGSSMEQLSNHIWKNRHRTDKILKNLTRVHEPLTEKKLQIILQVHGRLLKLIQPMLRNRQSPRSFISKYLHFHCPAVPIYDGIAASALIKMCPWKKAYEIFPMTKSADKNYRNFVFRFWQIYQEACKTRAKVSVKFLDHYILAIAKDDRKRKQVI